ncbi:MAG TPA: nucleotide disphospho-sugar-binding domain-containing protein [Solirubrobacteraceae bacterium]|jgi:MGT family glycosyltransferase
MRLLVYTSPARGHLYPLIPILLELRRRGHETSVLTLAKEVDTTRALGIQASAIRERVERIEMDDYKAGPRPLKGNRALGVFAARAEHDALDLHAAIEREGPDALLIDVNCWGAAIVAESSGLPWAVYCPYLLPTPSRDAPPFGRGLRPLEGKLGAARDALLRRAMQPMFERVMVKPQNRLRARYGVPLIENFTDAFARPPLLLALTAEGFEYPRHDWSENVRLVGPIHWSPVQSPPTWLAEMRDPFALVTCSTEKQGDERLIEVALRGLPAGGIAVIATTAAHEPTTFSAPAGSHVERFVSHDAVLKRVACVVCHGGMGIAQKALAAGVPVVVVPFGRDQLETARRVEYAGAGVRLPPHRLTPERLIVAVRAAIACRSQAERVSRLFAAAGGETAAASAIEELVAGRSGKHA